MRLWPLVSTCALAQVAEVSTRLSKSDSQRLASQFEGPQVGISMWTWADKYVYQPNENLTAALDQSRTNNDLYPYTGGGIPPE